MAEPNWLKIVVDICAVFGAFAAVTAVRTFRANAKLKRAEWLKALYGQFYESDRFNEIRRLLDYKAQPKFNELKEAVRRCDGSSEQLGLYLNFFEFVASLWKLDQLSLREVMYLFEYYIELFDDKELRFVSEYTERWGFENLEELRAAVRKANAERL
jgi:hypothetical protein